ncbi:MAG: fumarate hydratase, partial [Kiritimatiellae bacterium]|nr:fumarate hydratase [Kiritimatiellia bacterium]
MRPKHWEKNIFELIRRTSTDLPNDVESYLKRAYNREQKGSRAHWSLSVIMENIASARENDLPLCQDTGTLIFYFKVPVG